MPHRSTDSLLRHALRSMRTHFGMEVAFLSEFRDGRRVLRVVDAEPGAPPLAEGSSEPLEETYCQRIVDGRLPPLLADAGRNAEARSLPATRELPVGAHVGVPIQLSNGHLYGTFCCFGTRPDDSLHQRDVDTLRLFADFVARLLEQQLAHDQGRQQRLGRVQDVLRERRFCMVFQPIIDLPSRRVVSYEALARFQAEPVQPPDRWLADAAAVGLQEQLERALMASALASLPQLPDGITLSLNVSPATILDAGFATVFEGMPLHRIVLEVTEHASIADYDAIAQRLGPLRAAGLGLAVDDAGAGFASFRHILQLRPDLIKLDATLIRGIDNARGSRALAAALIRFAEETGCHIVAEGVETEAELAALRELKVDKAQGFLLGRPGPLPPRGCGQMFANPPAKPVDCA